MGSLSISARERWIAPVLETWVTTELSKWIAVQEDAYRLYFWHTHTGQEVDFLLARGEEIIAIEVTASTRVESRDLAGIELCEEKLGKRIRFSVVLYRGDQVIGLGRRRVAVPFDVAFLGPKRKA